MECPLCQRELPQLAALLAQTGTGTQCPSCWTRLRNLKPSPGKKRVRELTPASARKEWSAPERKAA